MKQLLIIILTLTSTTLFAQTANVGIGADSLQKRFMMMVRDSTQKKNLEKELYALLKSEEEEKWILARTMFNRLGNQSTFDSLGIAIAKKYPNGNFVVNRDRFNDLNKILSENDIEKKEVLYKEFLKKYPRAKAQSSQLINYDYLNSGMGKAYGELGNGTKALMYADLLESKIWRAEGMASIAVNLYKGKDTATGVKLFKRCLDIAEDYVSGRNTDGNGGVARNGYFFYVENYVRGMLYKKEYAEALKYANILKGEKAPPLETDNYLFRSLIGLEKNKEALDFAVNTINNGKGTPLMVNALESLYVRVNGSTKGFDQFDASMKKKLAENIREKLLKEIINVPAASFSLKDLSGKQVSLEDYKGKVLVLDFWATWCGPCIRSFPAMQQAVDKYAKDKDVAFLFIDTYEKDLTKYEAEVKKFMAEKGFRFRVLFDDVNPETNKQGVFAKAIGVGAIPAKFVIDGNAMIRFRLTGFTGSNEAAVEELSQMIEMARQAN